ncbi:transcriptional regulator GcvA [Azospirillum sp. RWY-5-1]|uniref:Transcriptional regulator GcvA n=1 Tax=Azospirillum oleiclasticum TaxID=2735135 RepID=A0ABX2TA98_9PROT|nr:transcriptional regulator GcvA [Azospirillum oleiclasticum]NYZ15313.1 transcriptional regulator GcvA [Azospirillum oleiclasticum]NYZ21266.1 transcriptional regulator GcvA [Azospirillum oleiclasticum]
MTGSNRRLPPLNALRAFEAAGRHLSFTRAAEELNVTQGAVSRHVKGLEEVLGVALFRRGHRGLELTREGTALLPRLSDGFDRLADAVAALRPATSDLTVKVLPTFAVRWLIPRLTRFQDRHPDLAVRLTTSWHEVDFSREDFDAGIVHGNHLHVSYDRLFPVVTMRVAPACAPSLLEGANPLRRPEDLVHHTLLHGSPRCTAWKAWLRTHPVPGVDPESGLIFDIDDSAWRAAASGAGVALCDLQFVAEDLAAGRLVLPFDRPVLELGSYYLVCPHRTSDLPAVMAFRAWLQEEAAAI